LVSVLLLDAETMLMSSGFRDDPLTFAVIIVAGQARARAIEAGDQAN